MTLQRRMPRGYKITICQETGIRRCSDFGVDSLDPAVRGAVVLFPFVPAAPYPVKQKTVTIVYGNDTGLRRFLDRTKKHHCTS
ncbi:hypothetical protein DUG15_07530 [Salmonella enterica]|uniref:Uncharacterized protein n=2 Tax=Salmonella enterica TaxID=28901 RepID=A0A403T252_SALER|nr:hypothetical protein [Salmonella enterica subsp. enterica serovar Hadar]EBJ4268808.1 hypothetical protein [Salmonella enterica]EBQ9005171.1 hypothetical protein [Salmonella enterica subsp. enterica serovar Blockley]EBR8258986.1 hypothetical protein [Salmonella enterica subsp. enterica serovar Cerro]EBW7251962.1 hypothetical protein [Salmonella enterica subsp. enterica serovar Gatow]EBX7469450.1 hypothetical protein [Salmonella enterica subsp. enterica serovar Bareilly]ECA3791419.1 hypothet